MNWRILIVAFAAALLSGCQVYSDSWGQAESLCSKNEGVRYVRSFAGNASAVCQNGAKFEEIHKAEQK